MRDAKNVVDRWLKDNITEENLKTVLPRAEHIFDALYVVAEDAGFSRDQLRREVPDLDIRVHAAVTALTRKGNRDASGRLS